MTSPTDGLYTGVVATPSAARHSPFMYTGQGCITQERLEDQFRFSSYEFQNRASALQRGRILAVPPITLQTRVRPSACCAALRSTLPGGRRLAWSRIAHVA